jgi:hypothetical protein
MRIQCLFISVFLCLAPSLVAATAVEVGTGVNTATVYIEWSDGFSIDFLVHFGQNESDTTTGLELMDIIEAETELTTVRNDFGWGVFIDGISYQGHSNEGYAGGELWWHYWENNAGSQNTWRSSMTGASGRTIAHGDADGWIYGHGDEPPGIDVVNVGSGVNQASVFIEWSDGFTAEFLVSFGNSETDTISGLGLMDIIEAETELTTVRQDSDWGVFIDGIGYQRHYNEGWAGGEDWWHYWVNNAGSRTDWAMSATGASGRVVAHSDADGWIYGHANAPAPASMNPFLAGYGQYVYDANDFATSVVAYEPTDPDVHYFEKIPYADPNTALGRPTVEMPGDGWAAPPDINMPIVPIYPAWLLDQIVSLGEGGSITLAFSHPVRDDLNNPYGLDFIVYGNALVWIDGVTEWNNGNPRNVKVSANGGAEPGVVSVSQDGQTWYSFTNDPNFMPDDPNFIKLALEAQDGPWADGFAPTLGHVYNTDPCNLDPGLGDGNLWWAEPTNPTLPVDPTLSFAWFEGKSVARIAETYGDAAGGVGFDLARLDLPVDPDTGLKWFQYVRIDDVAGDGLKTDIDAVADVSCPGDYKHSAPVGDLNGDYRVDDADVAVVEDFLGQMVTEPGVPAEAADLNGDGIIDQADVDIVISNLGACAWGCANIDG